MQGLVGRGHLGGGGSAEAPEGGAGRPGVSERPAARRLLGFLGSLGVLPSPPFPPPKRRGRLLSTASISAACSGSCQWWRMGARALPCLLGGLIPGQGSSSEGADAEPGLARSGACCLHAVQQGGLLCEHMVFAICAAGLQTNRPAKACKGQPWWSLHCTIRGVRGRLHMLSIKAPRGHFPQMLFTCCPRRVRASSKLFPEPCILKACSPARHCTAPLHIDCDASALQLLAVCHLVRVLHVVLVLVLDEGVALGLVCSAAQGSLS